MPVAKVATYNEICETQALNAIARVQSGSITLESHTLIREYLILNILFSNACRASGILHLTPEVFERARLESGLYVFQVRIRMHTDHEMELKKIQQCVFLLYIFIYFNMFLLGYTLPTKGFFPRDRNFEFDYFRSVIICFLLSR